MQAIFALCKKDLARIEEEVEGLRIALKAYRSGGAFVGFEKSDRDFWFKSILAFPTQAAYTGIESLLERLIKNIDGRLPAGDEYHKDLLAVAATDVPGVRPPILSEDVYADLDELRSFRHVARKRYGHELKMAKIAENAERLVAVLSGFKACLAVFEEAMTQNPDPSPTSPRPR